MAPTSRVCLRERLTDPQSNEGAEGVTAHSQMSRPLHNPLPARVFFFVFFFLLGHNSDTPLLRSGSSATRQKGRAARERENEWGTLASHRFKRRAAHVRNIEHGDVGIWTIREWPWPSSLTLAYWLCHSHCGSVTYAAVHSGWALLSWRGKLMDATVLPFCLTSQINMAKKVLFCFQFMLSANKPDLWQITCFPLENI